MTIAAHIWIFNQLPNIDKQIESLLQGLSEAGYEAIEGLLSKAPHDLATLQTAGLAYGGVHLTPQNLEPLEPQLGFLSSVHSQHICSSGPLEWNARTADDYRHTAKYLNEKGRRLRQHGVFLHYHNHEFEFAPIDGDKTGMEILLAEFDPEAVSLCFDAGWAELAGINAAEFMRQNAACIRFLHLRDFHGTQSVPLGQGDIELASQIALLSELPNLEYLVVEQDPSPNPLADMQASRRYLRETFGL